MPLLAPLIPRNFLDLIKILQTFAQYLHRVGKVFFRDDERGGEADAKGTVKAYSAHWSKVKNKW